MDDAVTELNNSRPASPVPPLPRTTYRFNWTHPQHPPSLSDFTDLPLPDPLPVLPHHWSSSTHGFNAISTVLNNPHKPAAPPKPHSSLPPVPPADLPRVRRKDFDSYLASVSPDWLLFQHRQDPTSTAPTKQPPPLSIVPQIYFDSNFHLGHQDTFAQVTQAPDDSDPFSIAHSLPLLEKLSHYADLIEQHLVQEISLRTSSFFAALTNLQDLHTESADCLQKVANLRRILKDLDDRTAKKGLHMVSLQGRLANIDSVKDAVAVLKHVTEIVAVASNLVAAGDWPDALAVIDQLQEMWNPPPQQNSIPLSSLHAFAALPAHLHALTLQITTSLAADLVSVLRTHLHDRIQGKPIDDLLLRDQIKPLLQGLVRTKGLKGAFDAWRDSVLAQVREAVKRHLPSADFDEEDGADSKRNTAKELREMPHDDFLLLLRRIYASLMRCIHGASAQSQIITELLQSISPDAAEETASLLTSTISATFDLSHALPSKLLLSRTETHAHLPLPAFHTLFSTTWSFVLDSEILCRRMIVSLRGAIVSQAKAFLGVFHAAKVELLARRVEEEVWAQVDVPRGVQDVVDWLVEGAMRDPQGFKLPEPQPIREEEAVEQAGEGEGGEDVKRPLSPPSTPPPPAPATTTTVTAKQLRIEERGYFVVAATLQALVLLLAEYVKLIVNLPLLTTDAMGRVIEFLKAFNSRACQVVLGAGAMRSAGLKNITAKHLALASQSLSIATALIPYIRETFRRHLSATQAVMLVEFDKLKRDYFEHQSEVHEKLVGIMGERVGVHCRALQEVRWNDAEAAGTGTQGDAVRAPNAYMEVLVKETVTLHKVLTKYLAAPAVEFVMTQVLAAINHRLSEAYTSIELESHVGKDRLLADVRYLQERLKHVGNGPGGMLETVVQEKSVPGSATKRVQEEPTKRAPEKSVEPTKRAQDKSVAGGAGSEPTAKRKLSEKLEAVVRGGAT